MEEQFSENAVAAPIPAKPKSGWLKTAIISVLVSAVISFVVFVAFAGALAGRVSVLEEQMAKQMSAYKVK